MSHSATVPLSIAIAERIAGQPAEDLSEKAHVNLPY